MRLHPKNKKSDYEEYINEIDLVSNGDDPLELILCCDLVIGSTTIFLLESAFLGKPTLSIIPKKGEEEWCPSVLNKMTPCAYTTKQINEKLNNYDKKNLVKVKFDNENTINCIIKKILK